MRATLTEVAENGAEVYKTKVHEYAQEYVDSLIDDFTSQEDVNALLRKPQYFKGMLKHVFLHVFKCSEYDVRRDNKNCRIDYADTDLLNSIWDLYTAICYRYGQNPTLLNFSILTGISMETFNSWKRGEHRSEGMGASSRRSETVKKWLSEAEAAAYDTAMSGNPGGMFILKSCYDYRETAPIAGQLQVPQITETAAQIMQKHQTAALLEPPDEPEEI